MNYAESITDLIGNTPLVRLARAVDSGSNLVLAKLEQLNPGASVKDRAALSMIQNAEGKGILRPGGHIIEATSGNTGISLAMIAAARGYRLTIVMPDSMSSERLHLLKALGARVEQTPAYLGMRGAIETAARIHAEDPDSFLVDQFNNAANPRAHEEFTAQEILTATDGKVDTVIAGVGTGGTITGLSRALKRHNHRTWIVAVEPANSPALSGGAAGPHLIQGIGAGFVPSIVDPGLIDEVIAVTDEEAISWTRKLIQTEGLLSGISSGAAACAANRFLSREKPENSVVVVILPDACERYLSVSTIFKK